MDAQAELLRAMYQSYFNDEEDFDIQGFFKGVDIKWLPDGRRAADALNDARMVEISFRYQGVIKAKGVLHAEAEGLVDEELLARVREDRRKVLEAVAELEAEAGKAQRGRAMNKTGLSESGGRPHIRLAEGGGWLTSPAPGFVSLTAAGAEELARLRG